MPTRTPRRNNSPGKTTDRLVVADGTSRAFLTLDELCIELQISRSTFYDWRAKRKAPRCLTLPNGKLRIRRADLDTWLNARSEDTA